MVAWLWRKSWKVTLATPVCATSRGNSLESRRGGIGLAAFGCDYQAELLVERAEAEALLCLPRAVGLEGTDHESGKRYSPA